MPPQGTPLELSAVRSPPPRAILSDRHHINPEWVCLVTSFEKDILSIASTVDFSQSDVEKQHTTLEGERSLQPPECASQAYIDHLTWLHPLSRPRGGAHWILLRWTALCTYNKTFGLVLILNLSFQVLFLYNCRYGSSKIATYGTAATAASGNFCIGILVRNEHVVNLLFLLACGTPHWVPLTIRRRFAKVYTYGSVHTACGISGTLWYLIFYGMYTFQFHAIPVTEYLMSITTGLVLAFLFLIMICAHPRMRNRYHNYFEVTHRFLGWVTFLCFWTQTTIIAHTDSILSHQPWLRILARTPPFWFLLVITSCICYPWARLRKRRVQAEKLSMQAVRLRFSYRNMDTCCGVRLTDAPLKETHSFATIPNIEGEKGFSVLISSAGDWTQKVIKDPPTQIWIRGAPVIGVARIALMFRKVVFVTTGTGIGPCLSFLQARPDYPLRVLWSARRPAEAYDSETMESVLRADPDAVVLDSSQTGRCNLLQLAYALFNECGAEAVIVISNPRVVSDVVGGLETRGIPAYGPIFDS